MFSLKSETRCGNSWMSGQLREYGQTSMARGPGPICQVWQSKDPATYAAYLTRFRVDWTMDVWGPVFT